MKEIIIYDVYDDDNVVVDNLVDRTTANESEDPNTSVGVDDNDFENCLEEFNVAEHFAALNQNVEIVETSVVGAAEGGAEENFVESNNDVNLESSVGPAKNGAPLTEEINNVVDEIVDNNPELNENVAEEVVEGMETEVSEVSLHPRTPLRTFNLGMKAVVCPKNLKM